jgi:hypothetical protein
MEIINFFYFITFLIFKLIEFLNYQILISFIRHRLKIKIHLFNFQRFNLYFHYQSISFAYQSLFQLTFFASQFFIFLKVAF